MCKERTIYTITIPMCFIINKRKDSMLILQFKRILAVKSKIERIKDYLDCVLMSCRIRYCILAYFENVSCSSCACTLYREFSTILENIVNNQHAYP